MRTLNKGFLLFLFSLSSFLTALGQNYFEAHMANTSNHNIRAVAAIQYLSDGALIIRLESNQNKLVELEKLANNEKLNPKQRQKFKNQAEVLKLETNHKQKSWISAFRSEYQFSEVFFIEDKDYRAFLMGARSGIFLNEDATLDPAINCHNANTITLGFGPGPNKDKYSAGVSVYLMDKKGQAFEAPFPNYYSERFQDYVLNLLINDGKSATRTANKIAKRLNKKLQKYCERKCGEILPPLD